jgi:hypothetical protein
MYFIQFYLIVNYNEKFLVTLKHKSQIVGDLI